jgi:uncharacterized membrane protein
MARKATTSLWIVRISRAHMRLWVSLALGAIAVAALPADWTWITRLLLGWDLAVVLYLAAAFAMMADAPSAEIKKHADAQDEGAAALLILTVAAALVSLAAIIAKLAVLNPSDAGYGFHIALAVVTVALSWTFTHIIFALHYAYEFYGGGSRGKTLKFPDENPPDYWDFVYFAFVIGMTFQVSDVAIMNKWVRRTVTLHGIVSFVFTTSIIALTVNMTAGGK